MIRFLQIICCLLFLSISTNVKSQSIVDKLPYTYRVPFPYGYIETTIHEDGTMTAVTYTGCVLCDGSGICRVCFGTGGQFYPNIGMMPCGRCFGQGRCQACNGKGYSIISSRTQYGITVGIDEHGKIYVPSGGNSGYGCNSSSDREKVEKIEYIPTYGSEANEHVYCPKCKRSGFRHIHVLK